MVKWSFQKKRKLSAKEKELRDKVGNENKGHKENYMIYRLLLGNFAQGHNWNYEKGLMAKWSFGQN